MFHLRKSFPLFSRRRQEEVTRRRSLAFQSDLDGHSQFIRQARLLSGFVVPDPEIEKRL